MSADRAPVVRVMSISRDEFFRTLPDALGCTHFHQDDGRVTLESPGRSFQIIYSEAPGLCMGSLSLPAMRVELRFEGYAEEEAQRTLSRFDLYFRRGGG